MVLENIRRKNSAPATGNDVSELKANWLRTPRRIAKALGLGAALLIATAIGTADAQVSGSWQKVRQGCKPGQLKCKIKAQFTVQSFVSTTILRIYHSYDTNFDDGGDDLLIECPATPPPGPPPAAGEARCVFSETGLLKMTLDLADPTVVESNDGTELAFSASASFLIAVADGGTVLAVFPSQPDPDPPGIVPTGIVLRDKLFGPEAVTIKVGTRVRWMHRDDGQDHTVTSGLCPPCGTGDGIFTSGHADDFMTCGFSQPGDCDEFVHVFDTVGTFPYFCEKHEEDMTGTIIVE